MCINSKACAAKAELWTKGTKQLDFARSIHKSSIMTYKFRLSKHGFRRQLERAISVPELVLVIKNGVIIHHRIVGKYSRSLILGYLPTQGDPRPLHVVLEYRHDEQMIEVKTIYDPRTKMMWSNDFKTKICFCDED